MSDPKIPRFSPLVDPRPPGPANRVLEEEAVRLVLQRQSDHEIKVDDSVRAIATHLQQRDARDKRRDDVLEDLVLATITLSGELGAGERMPPRLRKRAEELPPPPPPRKGAPPAPTPVHENAARSAAQSSRAVLIAIAWLAVELVRFVHDLFTPGGPLHP